MQVVKSEYAGPEISRGTLALVPDGDGNLQLLPPLLAVTSSEVQVNVTPGNSGRVSVRLSSQGMSSDR